MTVQELRDALANLPGDAIVRLWCDHGQSSMAASTISPQVMSDEDRAAWMCDDGGEPPEDGELANVVEIGAP